MNDVVVNIIHSDLVVQVNIVLRQIAFCCLSRVAIPEYKKPDKIQILWMPELGCRRLHQHVAQVGKFPTPHERRFEHCHRLVRWIWTHWSEFVVLVEPVTVVDPSVRVHGPCRFSVHSNNDVFGKDIPWILRVLCEKVLWGQRSADKHVVIEIDKVLG